jgi:hypothetical protein
MQLRACSTMRLQNTAPVHTMGIQFWPLARKAYRSPTVQPRCAVDEESNSSISAQSGHNPLRGD